MYIFGVDTPLVEIFFIIAVIIILLLAMALVALVIAWRLRRRLERLNKQEMIELERLKGMESGLSKVLESEKDELAFFEYLRKDIKDLLSKEKINLDEVKEIERELELKRRSPSRQVIREVVKEVPSEKNEAVMYRMVPDRSVSIKRKPRKKAAKKRPAKKKAVKKKPVKRKPAKKKPVKKKVVKKAPAKKKPAKRKPAKKKVIRRRKSEPVRVTIALE